MKRKKKIPNYFDASQYKDDFDPIKSEAKSNFNTWCMVSNVNDEILKKASLISPLYIYVKDHSCGFQKSISIVLGQGDGRVTLGEALVSPYQKDGDFDEFMIDSSFLLLYIATRLDDFNKILPASKRYDYVSRMKSLIKSKLNV